MFTATRLFTARHGTMVALGTLLTFAPGAGSNSVHDKSSASNTAQGTITVSGTVRDATTGIGIAGVTVSLNISALRATSSNTSADGKYSLTAPAAQRGSTAKLQFSRINYTTFTRDILVSGNAVRADASLAPSRTVAALADTIAITATQPQRKIELAFTTAAVEPQNRSSATPRPAIAASAPPVSFARGARKDDRMRGTVMPAQDAEARKTSDKPILGQPDWNREQYDRIEDNPFLSVHDNPRSTFSIDVDRAAYGNVRRFLNAGSAPPADAVRIEEMVNYFPYTLAQPKSNDPIAITTEVAPAPWQPKHRLVRVALQARKIEADALPPSNLVFLIDVSGSMDEPDKLPLVKESLRLLVTQLRDQDHVALVVYAGNAGLVLPSTSGSNKARIAEAIDRLEAGGSTAGGAGLELAYRTARENFLREGNNRVILATDGDFNVGASSDAEMERLIESKRSEGTYLTVLGFGTGNIQDAKMEKLAKKGNGNYAYVDNIAEARKTLVHELGSTLVTVANDVKLQVEFNPAAVSAYRLIGYEDRLLRDEDFTDDRKDAGDMGAGHSVTALYEVVPVGVRGTVTIRGTDSLRYAGKEPPVANGPSNELMYVKLRYKKPGDATSRLMTQAVSARSPDTNTSDDFRFAASVASFGMLLRNSEYKGSATAASVLQAARGALGEDAGGYRAEFLGLVQRWQDVTAKRGVAERGRW